VPIAERLGAPPTLDGVMLSGLAADRNRRPPTALLLAEGLETIAGQMEAAGTSRLVSKGSGITPPPPRPEPPTASESTEAGLLPATALDPSFFPPPEARMAGFEPASPFPAPVGPPAFQPPQEPFGGSYLSSGSPYPTSQLTTPPKALTPSRSVSYYVLLGVSALALFAISMFLTILVLR
jgi:eukaryotic-like serine/threonine-protein kinase